MRAIATAITLLVLSGCAAYTAKPLRKPALADLRSPTQSALAQAARRLRVPGMSPIALNFRKPLTGKELGVIAVLANPALRALRARARIARAQVFAAGLLPDPVIQFSALQPYGAGAAGHTVALADGFLWDLSSLVTRATNIRQAKAHAMAIHYEIAWREWVAANRARLTARRLYWLGQDWEMARKAEVLWGPHGALLAQDARAHLISGAKALAWEAAWDRLRVKTAALHRAWARTRFNLNKQLGLPPDAVPVIAPPTTTVPPPGSARQLFHGALARRLDLIALVSAYHSADSALLRAVLDQYPRLSLGFAGARDTSGLNQAGIQLSLVLPLFNRGRGAVAVARARRAALFKGYVARLAEARSQIYGLWARDRSLAREIRGLKGRSRALSRLAQAANRAYRAHALGLFPYLALMQESLAMHLQMTDLRLSRAAADIALQTATGTPWSSSRS
ncbi:MAG TPA: TolC family protein [Acidiferrobacter sp.]|nr:TolC family protein [Acidiferrobacter sp.]